jgi:hypothetical protein
MTITFPVCRSLVNPRTILSLMLACAMPIAAVSQITPSAAAKMEASPDHIHGGSDLTFKVKLNEPLPEGARFDVRLSPIALDQELSVSSAEPANKERTEFILKTKLPDKPIPGEWHIKVVWLFLSGASWTNNTLSTNQDFKFVVDGPKVEIPTTAKATLLR